MKCHLNIDLHSTPSTQCPDGKHNSDSFWRAHTASRTRVVEIRIFVPIWCDPCLQSKGIIILDFYLVHHMWWNNISITGNFEMRDTFQILGCTSFLRLHTNLWSPFGQNHEHDAKEMAFDRIALSCTHYILLVRNQCFDIIEGGSVCRLHFETPLLITHIQHLLLVVVILNLTFAVFIDARDNSSLT